MFIYYSLKILLLIVEHFIQCILIIFMPFFQIPLTPFLRSIPFPHLPNFVFSLKVRRLNSILPTAYSSVGTSSGVSSTCYESYLQRKLILLLPAALISSSSSARDRSFCPQRRIKWGWMRRQSRGGNMGRKKLILTLKIPSQSLLLQKSSKYSYIYIYYTYF